MAVGDHAMYLRLADAANAQNRRDLVRARSVRLGSVPSCDEVMMNDNRIARIAGQDIHPFPDAFPAGEDPGDPPAEHQAENYSGSLGSEFIVDISEHTVCLS